MNCSSCGTGVSAKQRKCLNCGLNVQGKAVLPPGAEGSSTSSKSHGLSPSSAKAPDPQKEVRGKSRETPARSRSKKKGSKTKSEPEISLETPIEEPEALSGSEFEIAAAQIRTLIHDRPNCLEEGLSIYADAKAEPVGIDFESGVGLIDLLARDDAGGLVVVLIASHGGPDSSAVGKELVSMALERVGWVSKHVAKPQQEVRAIVLLEEVPDDISYAATAVASTVAFKTYRSEIIFTEVDV